MKQRSAQLRIDISSPTPVYRQIVDGLRALLVEGVLRPGDTLPSVRALSTELGVHFNTVAEAYRLLAQEGWLEARQGRKAKVLERQAKPRPSTDTLSHFSARIRNLTAEMRAAGMSTAAINRALKGALKG